VARAEDLVVVRGEGAARVAAVRATAVAVALEATSWRGASAMAMALGVALAVVASLRAGHGSQECMVVVAMAAVAARYW
jgi:hypothetical protein